MALESDFQTKLRKEIENRFEGCITTKLDSGDIQGIPDLLILYKNKWAALEVKRSEHESHRPNQDYYVDRLGKMSYSSFIYPENKEKVLDEIEQAFRPRRSARVPKSK